MNRLLTVAWMLLILVSSAYGGVIGDVSTIRGPIHDTLYVRIVNTSYTSDWKISVCNGADTIYSGNIVDSLRFNLSASDDYSISCARVDTGVNARYFVRRAYCTSPCITITCSDYKVTSSSPTLNDIGARYSQFSSVTSQSVHTYNHSKLAEEFASLKQSVLRLRDDIRRRIGDNSTSSPSLDSAYLPITQHMDNIAARWSALVSLPGRMMMTREQLVSRLMSMPSVHAISDDGIVIESSESRFLFNKVAYAVAVSASHWFELEFPGIVERNKMTVDLARLIRLLVGSNATCEIAYGLFARSADRGVNYVSCDEPLPTYILELAASDSGNLCYHAAHDLRAVCDAMSISEVMTFRAINPAGKEVLYDLHPDSMYVLHFWGTWCAPCLQQEKSILLVGDTLSTMGFRMLHLAADIDRNSYKWRQHVVDFPADQYFVGNDPKKSLVRILSVNSYPSYIVIGRGNRILKRIDDYHQITKYVSDIKHN